MKGKELEEAIDFKKLTIVELQIKIEELKEKYPEANKLVYVTQSALIKLIFRWSWQNTWKRNLYWVVHCKSTRLDRKLILRKRLSSIYLLVFI
jgi:hypothetical protein